MEPPGGAAQPARERAGPKQVFRAVITGIVISAIGVAIAIGVSGETRDTPHRFLAHLRAGRDDDAYAMLSDNLRARLPRNAFAAYVETGAPRIRASQGEWIIGFAGDGEYECLHLWIHHGGLEWSTLYVIMRSEQDAWSIDDITEVEVPACDPGD